MEENGVIKVKEYEVINIIGEIEGHDNSGPNIKTTKYEHLLPRLIEAEENKEVKGLLVIVNTIGGDVSCGLAIAEMIAGMSKPSVSLVIGDSHSIGVTISVATTYSYIAPSATLVLHPVRMNGTILGAKQTYRQFATIQDRIVHFISEHSDCTTDEIEKMMTDTSMMSKDLGTILVGSEAVDCGLINEVGSISKAITKLHHLIEER